MLGLSDLMLSIDYLQNKEKYTFLLTFSSFHHIFAPNNITFRAPGKTAPTRAPPQPQGYRKRTPASAL